MLCISRADWHVLEGSELYPLLNRNCNCQPLCFKAWSAHKHQEGISAILIPRWGKKGKSTSSVFSKSFLKTSSIQIEVMPIQKINPNGIIICRCNLNVSNCMSSESEQLGFPKDLFHLYVRAYGIYMVFWTTVWSLTYILHIVFSFLLGLLCVLFPLY